MGVPALCEGVRRSAYVVQRFDSDVLIANGRGVVSFKLNSRDPLPTTIIERPTGDTQITWRRCGSEHFSPGVSAQREALPIKM